MDTSRVGIKELDVGIIGLADNFKSNTGVDKSADVDVFSAENEPSVSYTDLFFGGPKLLNNSLYSLMRPQIDPHITDPENYIVFFMSALRKLKKLKLNNSKNGKENSEMNEAFDIGESTIKELLEEVFMLQSAIISNVNQ